MKPNPLAENPVTDPDDRACVLRAKAGDRAALEELVARHQAWIYNIAVRMLYHPQDAEDATQEILVKALTALSSYEGRSSFRTWLYRVVINHVLNARRGRLEPPTISFSCYGHGLDRTPDLGIWLVASRPCVRCQDGHSKGRARLRGGPCLCRSEPEHLVQPAYRVPEPLRRQVGVALGHLDISVPQELLDFH
jgi:hypothetical protein